MKIAISNIAWEPAEEKAIADCLVRKKITGVEIAPTKIWPSPLTADRRSVSAYRRFWEDRGIAIVAFQALLFGRPDLTIFHNREKREETFRYLSRIIRLASDLGAKILVFGSPKNRFIGDQDRDQARQVAVDFFRDLAEEAQRAGTLFCLEPNAAAYGCDFILNAEEGRALVQQVAHPGFALHLDAGVMTLNGEPYEPVLANCFDTLAHFHISEPYLKRIGQGQTDHQRIAAQLKKLAYSGWVSIEMRNGLQPSNLASVTEALDFVDRYYGS